MANEFKVKKGLIVDGSNTVLDVQGTSGQLFSVTDSLTGDLFSVSDVSGVPILNVNSSGIVTVDGNIQLADNDKIQLGDAQDLELYHNGTNDFIRSNGTYNIFEANNHIFRNLASDEDYAKFLGDGAVELYHNGIKKFETTAGGAVITGTLDTSGTIVSTGGNIRVGSDTGKFFAGASNDLQMYHDGTHSYIDGTTTGDLYVRSTNDDVVIQGADDDFI
jgi:hypothetical protein